MRGVIIVLVLSIGSASYIWGGGNRVELARPSPTETTRAPTNLNASESATQPGGTPAQKIDFATQVKPVLQARCHGCHFPGGTMHQRLPFDEAATIRTLGEKLFTRIKDENERRLIRDFLAQ
jgi:hypothetical protein